MRPGDHPPGADRRRDRSPVFGTLHTSSAAKTIDRIVDVFPAEEKEWSGHAVRVAAGRDFADPVQVKMATAVSRRTRSCSRHRGHPQPDPREQDRPDVLRRSRRAQLQGMQTLDQCLTDLVRRNMVALSARARAKFPRELPGLTSRLSIHAELPMKNSARRWPVAPTPAGG